MFEVVRSFFLDGASFKRTVSDVAAFGGPLVALATNPEVAQNLAVLGVSASPKAQAIATLVSLAGALYSARARQVQTPPAN